MTEHVNTSPALIGVDWGSSNFRAFLMDRSGALLQETISPKGMLTLSQEEFESFLVEQISPWLKDAKLPILMTGMVGSAQGWKDAGYVDCPLALSAMGQTLCPVENRQGLSMAIVPGVRGRSFSGFADVMRGEEVQILGAELLQGSGESKSEVKDGLRLLCLPGTHAKWARVDLCSAAGGVAEPAIMDFATCMTGELFNVLCQHSILGRLIPVDGAGKVASSFSPAAFDRGVSVAAEHPNLLHTLFSARSAVVAGAVADTFQLSADEVHSYLSGLLIGAEMHTVTVEIGRPTHVTLVGGGNLTALYQRALELRDIPSTSIDGDSAVRRGLVAIASNAGWL
ncbi:2-dehydro-3-deoxygalactonokinase [Microbulbifer agarilyticus]|uniref:2-dehydro-3-deoxygalactonokinase n=1 Tax=Microbulbifer agarilyticus TaxID=260552 RepID=UPI001C98CC66|nr:2-dehydro-3-deoxygalactonokinase [Microbulbifer agarilyticus]MBY6212005.1 2-dehydro-3-deoxygalactonokinase [Microbulbifer agarilyticus]